MNNLDTIVNDFTDRLLLLIEGDVRERARAAVETALGAGIGARRPGRPSKALAPTLNRVARKKPPRQLCPVPGCKNSAAPVFGMVCAKHKDVPKAKIKKYREARRARKLKSKG